MNFIFFGSPEFAKIILEKLISAGFIPAAVVCNPDKPVGRKQVITPPPVKTRIMNYELGIRDEIKILQPEKLDEKFHNSLFILHDSFDFFVVAAYAKIIPKEIIDIPKLGVIGVHPSLLPKYRGATPIQSAILNGEKETGTTLFLIDEKVDHGPILANRELPIANRNYKELENELVELSGNLLVKTLPKFINGEIKPQEQNHNEATFTKKFTTEDGFVKPEDLEEAQALRQAQYGAKEGQKAVEIERKIRALNPDPGVWTLGLKTPLKVPENKRIKLLEGRLSPSGLLMLSKVQIEGKTPIALE